LLGKSAASFLLKLLIYGYKSVTPLTHNPWSQRTRKYTWWLKKVQTLILWFLILNCISLLHFNTNILLYFRICTLFRCFGISKGLLTRAGNHAYQIKFLLNYMYQCRRKIFEKWVNYNTCLSRCLNQKYLTTSAVI